MAALATSAANVHAASPNRSRRPLTRPSAHTPVVALLAELLLEVAQSETVALHGPSVGNLLAAEEIGHHRLTAAHPMASDTLFALLLPGDRQIGGDKAR